MKKGIAMVTLVVTIAVMITLVSVITYTGINTANTSKKIVFASEIKMVQESVDGYRTKNDGDYPISDFVTIDLTGASSDVKKQFTDNAEEIIDNKLYLSKIDYTKLDLNSLTRGVSQTDDDIYVFSIKTGIVYYAKGLKIGNNTYYTLTDELKNLLEYNSKSSEVTASSAIIFETNPKEWSNNDVKCSIKVPLKYECNDPTFNGISITNYNKIQDDIYITYTFEIENNGYINIKYNDNGEEKNASLKVDNIDKDLPEVYISKINDFNMDKKIYKVVTNDLTSGIKVLKYDIGKIDNTNTGKIYFNNNGKEVKDNIIEVDKDTSYISIYVEDNAGNGQIVQFGV